MFTTKPEEKQIQDFLMSAFPLKPDISQCLILGEFKPLE